MWMPTYMTWTPPGGQYNVSRLFIQWLDDKQFVLFWVAQDGSEHYDPEQEGYGACSLWSQRGRVREDLEIEVINSPVRLTAYLELIEIESIERTVDGSFGIRVNPVGEPT